MIIREVLPRPTPRRGQVLSLLLCLQFMWGPVGALLTALPGAAAAPVETQDASTEIITARTVFNGTEGSSYNATIAGPSGAMLGNVLRNFSFGQGFWGVAPTFDHVRVQYPGNLTLAPSASSNEVFYARAAAPPRDRDANGTTVWTAGVPTNSVHTLAIDQDGDGWLDDVVLGYSGVANRYYTYNQAGTQIASRTLPPGGNWINALAALDSDSNGALDQIAIASQSGILYMERFTGTNLWSVTVPGSVPLRFVAGADLNGDGMLESAVVGADDPTVPDDGTLFAFNGTGVQKWTYSTGGSPIVNLTSLAPGSARSLSGVLVATEGAITALGALGQVVWNYTANTTVTAAAALDFNHDGLAEGAVYADAAGGVSFIDGNGTLLAWTQTPLVAPLSAMSPADFDADGWLDEVAVANATDIFGIDRNGTTLWNFTVGAGFSVNELVSADFDGNGTRGDTIVATSDTLYALNRTGALRWSASEARNLASAAFVENPSAALSGSYISPELDALTGADWVNLTFASALNTSNETLEAFVRFGIGSPGSVTWGPWLGNFSGPTVDLSGNSSRFAQVRFDFTSLDGRNSANLSSFRLNFTTPALTGSVVTAPLSPSPGASWLDLDAAFNVSGGAVRLYYSGDGGLSWRPFLAGSSVDGGNASAPSLSFKVEMDLGATSPNIAWVSVRYTQAGLRPTVVAPAANATITGVYNVSAVALPSVVGLLFQFVNPATNTTFAIGPASFDGALLRWWALWNTSGLDGAGFTVRAVGTDTRGFTFTGLLAPVNIDNTPPTVRFTTPLAGANLTGGATLTASASPDTASVLFSYFDGSITPIGSGTQSSPGVWSIVWNTVPLGEREGLRLYASAADGVGLVGTDTVFPVTVDNIGPWVRVDTPVPPANVTGLVPVTLSASPDVVQILVFQNGSEGAATKTGSSPNASFWAFSWDTTDTVTDPSATLTVNATDRVGFWATNTSGPYTIDNTGATADLLAPANFSVNTGTVHLVANATPNTQTLLFQYQECAGCLPKNITTMTAADKNATTGLWEFDWDTRLPARIDFNGSLFLVATPTAGKVGTSKFGWIVVDNSVPFVHFTSPAVGTPRLAGNVTIEVFADADVVSVRLSYTNESSGQSFDLGLMNRADVTRWTLVWAVGTLFVPTATLHVSALDRVGFTGIDDFDGLIIGLNPGDNPPSIVRSPTDVIVDEDFPPYELNITTLVQDDDPANVTAYIDGVDPALVTLHNNGSRGLASLWFFSVPNAHSKTSQSPLRLRVVDASGQVATANFGLFVRPVNDPPSWLTPRSPIYVHNDTPYRMDFSFYVHDVEFEQEGAPLTITTDDARVAQDASLPLTMVFTFAQADLGRTFLVNFSLSDGDPTFPPQVLQLKVIVTSDWVPQLKDPSRPIGPIVLQEDTPRFNVLDLSDYFSDPDDTLLFYYTQLPPGFSILFDGSFVSVNALPRDWFGTVYTFFGANDSTGAFVEARVAITVLPVNDAPTWDFSKGLDVTSFFVHFNTTFTFDFSPYVVDVDSPRSDLRLSSSDPTHAWIPINSTGAPEPGQGLILQINYSEAYNGTTQTLSLHVSDGLDNSTVLSIQVHVSDNYPPRVSEPLPKSIVLLEGQTLSNALNLSHYFADKDGVLYFAFGLVNVTVKIDNATGMLSLSSPSEWSGTEVLIIRALDDKSAFLDSSILVTVVPVDDPPFISGLPDLTVDVGVLTEVRVAQFVRDPDTPLSALVFSASTAYPGAFISIANGTLRFVYSYNRDNPGPAFDAIRLCVSDGTSAPCAFITVHLHLPSATPFNWLQFFAFVATSAAGAIVVARHFVEFKVKRAPTVEDIFLVYEDGILIKHISKKVRKYADEDVVTSMLSAIQSFAADSFEDTEHWDLREVAFRGRKILIEKARKFQIFLIFDGDANEDLKKAVLKAADAIGKQYAKHLRDWDGDPSHFDGVEKYFAELLGMERAYIPSEVSADELVKAPLVPGSAYVSESDGFTPLIKAYLGRLEGLAVVRVRPSTDGGKSIAPLAPEEVSIVEVAAPKGKVEDEEDGGDGRTGLDIAMKAVEDALEDAKTAVRSKAPLILFEGFEFIVDRYGFVYSKKFADQLKRLAATEGAYLFVAVDPTGLSAQQLEGLERNAVVLRGP